MKTNNQEDYPLGFKFPRRVKVISKRINLPTNELIQILEDRGVDCIGTTYLRDEELLKIKDLIVKRYRKDLNKEIKPKKEKFLKTDLDEEKKIFGKNDVQKILDKIRDYEGKIKSKRTVKVGRKMKKKPIPGHLRSFYLGEIKKLKIQLNKVGDVKKENCTLQWDKLVFENYQFRAYYRGGLTEPYLFKDSRKSFNFLKSYFDKLNLKPLECMIEGMRIKDISNIEELYKAVQIVTIKEIVTGIEHYNPSTTYTQVQKLSNSFSKDLIKRNKNQCLNYLSSIHNAEFKIIPIFENQLEEGDSFLFTIKKEKRIALVWESCSVKKATYIFHTSEEEYFSTLIYIIRLIQSEEVGRMDIRQALTKRKIHNMNGHFIYHDDFTSWRNNLWSKTTANNEC